MRYLAMVIICLPTIIAGLINIVTNYKLKKISSRRFHFQVVLWIFILAVLLGSFPLYNLMAGNPIIDSKELSLFDIVQTGAIVFLIYIINNQRQRIDLIEKRLRKLHQELSIRLSDR